MAESGDDSSRAVPSPSAATPEEPVKAASTEEQGDGAREGKAEVPGNARELFRRAEALCEKQQFSEAVPLFEKVLAMLQESDTDDAGAPGKLVVMAEVWAHLGVAMQSLDRVPEAINSYQKAVALDSSLHVCYTNLATLHAYMQDRTKALENIEKALALDPKNPTYLHIKQQLGSDAGVGQAGPSAGASTPDPEADEEARGSSQKNYYTR